MDDQLSVRWAIIGPRPDMLDATMAAGVDPNALRSDLLGTCDDEASLVWPSFFCAEPKAWFAALALLIDREVPVRLYVVQTPPGQPTEAAFTARLYPRLDSELRDLLDGFSPVGMAAISHATEQVDRAIRRLRQAAGLE